jgi:hypothetical protein
MTPVIFASARDSISVKLLKYIEFYGVRKPPGGENSPVFAD